MTALDMDTAPLDLSREPLDILVIVPQKFSLRGRFTCALVCKAWAKAAVAATRSIVLKHRVQDLSCLQRWLEKHGNHLTVLQLNLCGGAALSALPCPQLQDLQLSGAYKYMKFSLRRMVWSDIAAATKLTSVSLSCISTPFQPTDVMSALTALPDLQQLTWKWVKCSRQDQLSDALLLQQLTKLTRLDICDVTTEALQHLGSLTRLQHLSTSVPDDWAAADCPGLQDLKALTRLQLVNKDDIPASISRLTALKQLEVSAATLTAVNGVQVLTGLTRLCVAKLTGLSLESPALQLPGLQHLELKLWQDPGAVWAMPMSFLSKCTQLRVLSLNHFPMRGPGSLVTSTMLQDLVLYNCRINAADPAAGPVSWQQVLPGPGQLPHLTSLQLLYVRPSLQQADLERVVSCCSSLQVLSLDTLLAGGLPLVQLHDLTSLHLMRISNTQQCSSLAQLTGLRELRVDDPKKVSVAGLRQLTALEQLTSLGFIGSFDPSEVNRVLQEQMSDKLPDCSCALINQAPASCPPDVAPRLLQACDMAAAAGGLDDCNLR